MSELSEQEKKLLEIMKAAEEEELKKPPSERPAPMPIEKTKYPIGIQIDEEKADK
ncbi:hypothetical protein [Tychonema sp. LEGE 07203]|uniref:hypothetical protein n=1 Tax=Tychonema sp. LEGE 07203 TaxID=1828671 RepID=UPI0018803757|nr:hypothetical protein [Tychonema sp. LEGE 07203]MBE9093331.1 hypothetical protein [Tychonema sp. LEGE 07203]